MDKNVEDMHVKIHPVRNGWIVYEMKYDHSKEVQAWVEKDAFVYSDPACLIEAVKDILEINTIV